ncbi:MAG TPA: hypothetical protein VFU84_03835 [Gaiellaceae bacterium]|nr:hypothetical protein [Gaiellaceae bacterium]
MFAQLNLVRLCLTIVLATLAVALAGAQSATAISAPVVIDAVSVENGVAVVTGFVDAELVEVNGQLVEVAENGAFSAPVDISADALVLEILESPNELVTITVPIDVLLATGGEGVLTDLVDAGIAIDRPAEGFRVVDGEMPLVEGRVLDDSNLEALEVNGIDVRRRLGDDGPFSIDLGSSPSSSTSRETVTFVARDQRGVSQTSTFSTTKVTSTIATRAGTSVSAAGARGVVISRMGLDSRYVKSAKHLRVLVTVKDRRGYLIRGAALQLRAMPAKHVADGALRAAFTNRVGKAQFAFRLKASAFEGGLLTIAARAATPKSTATRKVALRLPAAVTR